MTIYNNTQRSIKIQKLRDLMSKIDDSEKNELRSNFELALDIITDFEDIIENMKTDLAVIDTEIGKNNYGTARNLTLNTLKKLLID